MTIIGKPFRSFTALALLAGALAFGGWLAGAEPALAAGEVADEVDGAADALVTKLKKLRPGIPIERVTATPVAGIFALEISGGTVYYGTADGRYLFAGDLYELGDDDLVNLAEVGRTEMRRELLGSVPRDEMVIFSPKGPVKAAISVFTDVDCGYCQHFHKEVPELNRLGIEVRYLAWPRAGIGSRSYEKIVSAWCADDPNTALTRLKAQQSIPSATCPNPVADQYDLGRELGVTGTPAIILEDGTLVPGYMPAAELAKIVGIGA